MIMPRPYHTEQLNLDGTGGKPFRVYEMESLSSHDYWASVTDVPCPSQKCGGLGEYRLARAIEPKEILFGLAETRIRCTQDEGTAYACHEYEPHRHCPVCGDLLRPGEPDCCEDEE